MKILLAIFLNLLCKCDEGLKEHLGWDWNLEEEAKSSSEEFTKWSKREKHF